MKKGQSFVLLMSLGMVLASCGGVSSSSKQSESSSSSQDLTSQIESSTITSSDAPLTSSDPIESSSSQEQSSPVQSSAEESSEEEAPAEKKILRIAYHQDDNKQDRYALWIWADGINGKQYDFEGPLDENFHYFDIDLSQPPFAGVVEDSLFFIVKVKDTWAGQSADTEIFLSDFEWKEEEGALRTTIYCCDGAGGTIECYDDPKGALGNKFTDFLCVDNQSALSYEATADPLYVNYYVFDKSYYDYPDDERLSHRHDYLKLTLDHPSASQKVNLSDLGEAEFDPHKTYCITGAFGDNISKTRTKYVDMKPLFDSQWFVSKYTYGGNDLGCQYDASSKTTTFRVWAPTSAKAEVMVYKSATPRALNLGPDMTYEDDNLVARIPLTDVGGGVYAASFNEKDLKGCGYVYRLYREGASVDALDPFAVACGASSRRGAIVDMSETTPENYWEDIANIDTDGQLNKLTIYEAHVRDVTSHESWNGKEAKGTYKAFVEEGTTYQGIKTGFDHILDTGINAVQILPVFDQSGDERTYDKKVYGETKHFAPGYNWGYNPQLYNCVEGSYSSDPYNPLTRIREFKNVIQSYAKHNVRVIMDVVYNHVASVSQSPFTQTVPGYFFLTDAKGNLMDYTGCGNTVNSDRVMGHNFIVNSVAKWAELYGVLGFRFDLMGAINLNTMRAVKDRLYEIDPRIVAYGEPWSTAGQLPDRVYNELGDNGKGVVGGFNNGGRDGLKGDTTYANVTPSYGFMNTGIDHMNANIKKEADAAFMGFNPFSGGDYASYNNPAQTVNYVSCHDNYTLFDQFNATLRGEMNKADTLNDTYAADAVEASIATLGATMISEGAAFIQGGDEFFRAKIMEKGVYLDDDSDESLRTEENEAYTAMVDSYKPDCHNDQGDHWTEGDGMEMASGNWLVRNSYKYGDKVNAFDYTRLARYESEYNKVKEVIALRNEMLENGALGRNKDELGDGKATMWGDTVNGVNPTEPIIAAYMKGAKNNRDYYVVLSGRETPESSGGWNNIGVGECTIVVDYSSNNIHSVGQECDCTSTLGAGRFEFMVCHVKAN